MKTLMVDSLVGSEYPISLCNSLEKAGLDISLVSTQNRKTESEVNFPLKRWSPSKKQFLSKFRKTGQYIKYLMRLFMFIKAENVDIVHFQFFRRERIETFYFLLLRLVGVKLVYTAHNVLPHEHNKIDPILKSIIYKSTNIIVVHTRYIKNKLVTRFKIDPEKVYVIPHGNYDTYLPKEAITKNEARNNLNLAEKDPVMLFFGHIREYKGLDTLLDAFEIASQENSEIKLLIAGEPQTQALKDRYVNRIKQIAANDRIIFKPGFIPTDKVAEYFTASDIVVLPYKHIDHSGIVHMAYSFGKPIIATKVGDFGEVIEVGRSGFLLEKNDAVNLSETIIKAFSDKRKLEEMGDFSRKLNETKYSWDNIAVKTIRLYENIKSEQLIHDIQGTLNPGGID